MTIKIIKTGDIQTVNDNYGLRLITQGTAVRVKEVGQSLTAADHCSQRSGAASTALMAEMAEKEPSDPRKEKKHARAAETEES